MNPMTEDQWRAWLEATNRFGADHMPYDRAIAILHGEIGDTITRDSLQLFIAGWQAGYWTDRT